MLLLSMATIYGNPLFSKVPEIIMDADTEFKAELLQHLRQSALVNFGPYAAAWIYENYALINEDTWNLCRRFDLIHS